MTSIKNTIIIIITILYNIIIFLNTFSYTKKKLLNFTKNLGAPADRIDNLKLILEFLRVYINRLNFNIIF